MWRWPRHQKVDPNRVHPFLSTNDGFRWLRGAQSNTATLFAVPVLREVDPKRARCEVPGCLRLRDDRIHGAPED